MADDYMLGDGELTAAQQAALEQAQAQFVDDVYVLMTFTHAAALAALRGNPEMQQQAAIMAAQFIDTLDMQQTRILLMKMAGALATATAKADYNGDLEASMAAMSGPKDFLRVEAFIATNGALCLFCGLETATTDGGPHVCHGSGDHDDHFE
jgi:hypothetical protein